MKTILVILSALTLLLSQPAFADRASDLRDEISDLRTKIASRQHSINKSEEGIAKRKKYGKQLEDIPDLESSIKEAKNDLEAFKGEMAQMQKELDLIEKKAAKSLEGK